MMDQTAQDSARLSKQANLAVILLGVVGPIAALTVGYNVARGLSRSIYKLSVHVQDMVHHLDQDVASMNVAVDGNIENLDRQLEHVVGRVEQFLTEGLLSRFRAATTVLPTLLPLARVVLVAGHTNIDIDAPDDAAARGALLRGLAHALRAERAPERLSVKICDHTWTARELVSAVLQPGQRRTPPSSDPTEATRAAYADWRTEVLGLMGAEF